MRGHEYAKPLRRELQSHRLMVATNNHPNMRLSKILVAALTPHAEQLSDWTKNDFEMLFLGFGNLRIFTPARIEFAQTFWNNALDICLALDEMGFGDMDFLEKDIYYLIYTNPGEIRRDLHDAIIAQGNEIDPWDDESAIVLWDAEGPARILGGRAHRTGESS